MIYMHAIEAKYIHTLNRARYCLLYPDSIQFIGIFEGPMGSIKVKKPTNFNTVNSDGALCAVLISNSKSLVILDVTDADNPQIISAIEITSMQGLSTMNINNRVISFTGIKDALFIFEMLAPDSVKLINSIRVGSAITNDIITRSVNDDTFVYLSTAKGTIILLILDSEMKVKNIIELFTKVSHIIHGNDDNMFLSSSNDNIILFISPDTLEINRHVRITSPKRLCYDNDTSILFANREKDNTIIVIDVNNADIIGLPYVSKRCLELNIGCNEDLILIKAQENLCLFNINDALHHAISEHVN